VPPLLAVIPAGLASVLLTVLTVAGAAGWSREMHVAGSPTGAAAGLMTAAYAPLLAWGPLLGLATLAFWLRRHRQPSTNRSRTVKATPAGREQHEWNNAAPGRAALSRATRRIHRRAGQAR
jgi:hypothetical protein